MKKVLLLSILLLSSLLHSQTKFKNNSKLPRGFRFLQTIALDNGDIIQISENNGKYCLQRLDNALHLIKKTKLSIQNPNDSKLRFASVIQLKNRFFLYFYSKNKESYLYTFYSVEFDSNTMSLQGELTQITPPKKMARGSINSLSHPFSGYYDKYFDNVNAFYKQLYVAKVSPDSSKFLIAFSIADSLNTEPKYRELSISPSVVEKIFIQVVDNSLKNVWNNDFFISEKNDRLEIKDLCLSNDGEVIAAALVPGSFYRILIFSKDSSSPKNIPMNLEASSFQTDAKILPLGSSKYVIAGPYRTNSVFTGFYSVDFDIKTLSYSQPQFISYKPIGLADNIFALEPRAVLRDKDNSYKLVYEKNDSRGGISSTTYSENRQVTFAGSPGQLSMPNDRTYTSAYVYEVFGDIYVLSVDPNGKIDWIKNIPKFQKNRRYGGENHTYISIECGLVNNKLHIAYIDNEDNFGANTYSWKNDTKLGKFACLADIEVDSKGNFQKTKLAKVDDIKFNGGSNLGLINNSIVLYHRKRLNATKFFFVKK